MPSPGSPVPDADARRRHAPSRRPPRLGPLLLFAAFAASPGDVRAQDARAGRPAELTDRNGHPFRTPAASPIEGIHRVAFVSAEGGVPGDVVALVHLGDRLGFWLRDDPDGLDLAAALHGGAFSRFDLEGPDNEFIEINFRLGVFLRARAGGVAGRLEVYHVSSHLGDELQARTGREPISTSREGAELLLQVAPLPGLSLYGGPGLLLRTSQDYGRASLRGGAEWNSSDGGSVGAYGSVELLGWQELDWRPRIALEAGARLGRHARVGILAGRGPSRAEQFFREDETLIGLTVSYIR